MDEYGQVRATHPTFRDDVRWIADLLEDPEGGTAFISYAAEGSRHEIIAMESAAIAGRNVGHGPQGIGGAASNEYTLWVICSWTNTQGWLRSRVPHDPGYIQGHLVKNAVDAVAIAELINHVERERAERRGSPWTLDLDEAVAGWYEALGRSDRSVA